MPEKDLQTLKAEIETARKFFNVSYDELTKLNAKENPTKKEVKRAEELADICKKYQKFFVKAAEKIRQARKPATT
jgi:hypothetical protein